MRLKRLSGILALLLGGASVWGDVSEMIFYPEADFSEGVFHYNYQGEKNKSYGFMFDQGFDPERIMYVRPANYTIQKGKNGAVQLHFANTDRYSYIQKAKRDDFLVSEEKGTLKILLSGGDCTGSVECANVENILSVAIPKGYGVRSYQGLDHALKPLKNPHWQRKGNLYTLIAKEVKGAYILMELHKGSEHIAVPATAAVPAITPPKILASAEPSVQTLFKQAVASAPSVAEKPLPPAEAKPAEAVRPAALAAVSAPAAPSKPAEAKPIGAQEEMAPYFRNFQLFESQRVLELSPEGKERLKEWLTQFKAGRYSSVTIEGYTDNIPPQRIKHLYATNEILSQARAQLVADYLISIGLDRKMVQAKGMGDAHPLFSNDTEEGRSKNRRIEFVLIR